MLKLVPWRWRERELLPSLGAFRGRMDHLFRKFRVQEPFRSQERRGFAPTVDISETEKEIIVKAEIPGIDPTDLDVSIDGDTLTIRGEKKEEWEEKGESFHRAERYFGSFACSFALPCHVQEDEIKAEYKDGVLSLKIPKAEPEEIAQDRPEVPEGGKMPHMGEACQVAESVSRHC